VSLLAAVIMCGEVGWHVHADFVLFRRETAMTDARTGLSDAGRDLTDNSARKMLRLTGVRRPRAVCRRARVQRDGVAASA
jgi:hypothetical protein